MFVVLILTTICIGCSPEVHALKIENASYLIQKSEERDNIQKDEFFFELLHYHQQRAYLENGHVLTKWMFEGGEFICDQIIMGSDLFPSEYEDIDRTIEYIKSYAINMVSNDGRFISVFNGRDPLLFYVWDVEEDKLFKISSPSPIRKMQWMDDEPLLCLLTEQNNLYTLDPDTKHIKTVSLQAGIPDIDNQHIFLSETYVVYFHGISVLMLKEDSAVKTILKDVSELFGVYKNTIVVKRMNRMIEVGNIRNEWKPFYSDKMNLCYPVNGRYLRFHDSENHDELWLMDLMNGDLSSFQTCGHGYEVFPNTAAILFFDNDGTPYSQRSNEIAELLQLGEAEPYVNKASMIPQLMREEDGGISLMLFSLEAHQYMQLKMNTKGK